MEQAALKSAAAWANNRAWTLLEDTGSDASELLALAAGARELWTRAGTAGQIAHADLLFGWAAARAGAVDLAVEATQAALAHFEAQGAEDWELAFAHAACAAAGRDAAEHRKKAREFGAKLTGPDAKYFEAAVRTL